MTTGSVQPENPSGSRYVLPVFLWEYDAVATVVVILDKYSTGTWQYSTNPKFGHGPQFYGHVLMLGY